MEYDVVRRGIEHGRIIRIEHVMADDRGGQFCKPVKAPFQVHRNQALTSHPCLVTDPVTVS